MQLQPLLLLLQDGRLGLIDYGQVKRMTIQERINYARLIKAHSEMDYKEVVRLHFDVLATKTKDRKEDIKRMMNDLMAQFTEAIKAHPEQYFWYNKRWVLDPI